MTPTLIVVTGPAGSGKTTLAHLLAGRIGCPALCRDELKEGMAHATPGFAAAASDPLTLRTYDLFFATIARWLEAGVSHVAEAAFQDRLWRRGLEPLRAMADLRVVRCRVAAPVALERQQLRMAEPTRVAHADADWIADPPDFVPIALDVPTLDVDTTADYRPVIDDIVAFLR